MAGTLTISTLSDGTNSTSSTNCIQGSAKAWICYKGTATVAIRSSYNVSSVTVNGTGDYTINLTTALANTNFAVSACASDEGSFGSIVTEVGSARTTSATRIQTFANNGTSAVDVAFLGVSIFSS